VPPPDSTHRGGCYELLAQRGVGYPTQGQDVSYAKPDHRYRGQTPRGTCRMCVVATARVDVCPGR
jgi:hypothetical protein